MKHWPPNLRARDGFNMHDVVDMKRLAIRLHGCSYQQLHLQHEQMQFKSTTMHVQTLVSAGMLSATFCQHCHKLACWDWRQSKCYWDAQVKGFCNIVCQNALGPPFVALPFWVVTLWPSPMFLNRMHFSARSITPAGKHFSDLIARDMDILNWQPLERPKSNLVATAKIAKQHIPSATVAYESGVRSSTMCRDAPKGWETKPNKYGSAD